MSGGLDSAYSLLRIAKEKKEKEPSAVIHPIFFDYGQFAAEAEWASVAKIVRYIRSLLNEQSIVDDPVKISLESELFQWSESDVMKGLKGKLNLEIENRNLVLSSVLASYLMACTNHQNIPDAKFIISSGFKDEEMKDCGRDFFDKIEILLSLYKPAMKFHFDMLKGWSRKRVIHETEELLGSNKTKLNDFCQLTISCNRPSSDGKPCGGCSKCISLELEKTRAHS